MKKEVLFAHFEKLTHLRYQSLIELCGSLDQAWEASAQTLSALPWKKAIIAEFFAWRQQIDERKVQQTLEKEDITTIVMSDDEYPPLLRELYDPPLCLFARGSLHPCRQPLAVVGPRKYSAYGKFVAETFVHALANAGMTIVSGLAMGIDGIAHQATLDAGGKTIAVLGGGIDKTTLHPRIHTRLADAILENGGAIISEFPPGTKPTVFTFPKRNRIIAGLSMGTLVVEAAKKSGALITAQCALDIGRDVFAPPQNISSVTSEGTNQLLQEGAHLVTDPHDILSVLHIAQTGSTNAPITSTPATPEEQALLKHLTRDPVHIDELAKKVSLPGGQLSSTLTLLELHGRVKNLGNMTYILLS